MAEWPNVGVTGRIAPLFDHIRKVNVPPKVTVQWLEAAGFKSKNDRPLIGLLKGLGYLDGSSAPIANKWAELRGNDADRKASIGRQMQVAYPQVFQNYPVTHIQDVLTKDELRTFVRPKVQFGEQSVGNVVDTFFGLKAIATFDTGGAATPAASATVTVSVPPASPAAPPAPAAPSSASGAVNIDIHLALELPVTTDADVYDKLFESMAKHLGTLIDRGR